jgi:roadblock/LC7 domain-containing protein
MSTLDELLEISGVVTAGEFTVMGNEVQQPYIGDSRSKNFIQGGFL